MTRRRAASSTTPLVSTRTTPRDSTLGAYDVVAPIARGGTAGVYLAEHRTTGEKVALKVIDPHYAEHAEIVERLLGERTVSQRIHHASLLDVHLADRSATGVAYLVMEYLDGENLGELADRGRIAAPAVLAIASQVACALGALHAARVVHCDVKPDNIFVLYDKHGDGWPRIKVIDYGVARFLDDAKTADCAIAGTPSYMPPEQWRGEPTAASDVYSLGCTLHELLTGDQLFHGTLPQLMQAHCERIAPRLRSRRPELPEALDNLIARALSKDLALRPGMLEMEVELLRIRDALVAQ
ncbi:MAG: serine/threonine protein kinase [Deltaproteobacteria bacterium]|nr:serine/threonine protein kinase [Deltaproteobacteria bacterium]